MGYKTNQFYNLPTAENAIRNGDVPVRTNKSFDYPDNRVRTYRRDGNKLIHDTRTLRRGYIRSLQNVSQTGPTTLVARPVNRCDFQFNPSTLQQSVSMRTDVLNVFLQDPVQLTQPLASQTQFGFSLMFDRTFTYNNESDETINPDDAGLYDIANIGVLHDIRLLYAIIGQGISEDLIASAIASARNTAIVEARENNTSDTSTTSTEGGVVDIGLGIPDNFDSLANSYFSANLGNSGFLIPLPVRIVFSSLYMIDGYVTDSSIVFTKFSTSYVPIQCMVNLTMKAMYIGFAKERTFLSQNLEDAQKQVEGVIQTNKRAAEDANKVLPDYQPQLTVILETKDAPKVGNNNVVVNNNIAALVSGEVEKTKRTITLRIPNAYSQPVSSLFENNPTSIRVSLETFIEVYSVPSNKKQEFIDVSRLLHDNPSATTQRLPSEAKHVATLSARKTISTLEEWKSATQGSVVLDAGYSPHAPLSTNDIATTYNYTTPQYVVLYRSYMNISAGSSAIQFSYKFRQVELGGKLSDGIKNPQTSNVISTNAATSS
jgi:hypothetical protein